MPHLRIILIFFFLIQIHVSGIPEFQETSKTRFLLDFKETSPELKGQNRRAELRIPDGMIHEKAFHGSSGAGVEILCKEIYSAKYPGDTVEAVILLEKYPESRAYIFDKIYQCDNDKVHNNKPLNGVTGLSLFVDSKGRIGSEQTTLFYGSGHKKTFYAPDNVVVPLGKKIRIALVNIGFPVNRYAIYLDDKSVVDRLLDYNHRLYYDPHIRDTAPARIMIGNNGSRTAHFTGLIYAVRYSEENLSVQETVSQDWLDPRKEKVSLPAKSDAAVSFDCEKEEALPPGCKLQKHKYVSGVYGNAIEGKIEFRGEKLPTGRQGSVEFFLLPQNWSNRSIKNHPLIQFGGNNMFAVFYIFNTPGDLKPISWYFPDENKKLVFINAAVPLEKGLWKHIVLTWDSGNFCIYIDGVKQVSRYVENIRNFMDTHWNTILFSEGKNEAVNAFDQIRIYDRKLNEAEVLNHFRIYADPEKANISERYLIHSEFYPGEKKLLLSCSQTDVHLYVNFLNAGKSICSYSGKSPLACDLSGMPSGKYELFLEIKDNAGKLLQKSSREFVLPEIPWLRNTLGIPSRVPSPWQPLTIDDTRTIHGTTAAYQFGKGFIQAIMIQSNADSKRRQILAAPISLSGMKSLKWKEPELQADGKGLAVNLFQQAEAEAFRINIKGVMEFDGMIRCRIQLAALETESTLSEFALRIPLKAEYVRDYYVIGEQMDYLAATVPTGNGVFYDDLNYTMNRRHNRPEYGAVRRDSTKKRTLPPFAWTGSNHAGISVLLDNFANYVISPSRPILEFERKNETILMTVNFITKELRLSKGEVRDFEFVIMATPMKKTLPGWRNWKTASFFPLEKAGRTMGASMFYAPYPADWRKSAAYIAELKKTGVSVLPYFDFLGMEKRMEPFALFMDEWFKSGQPNYRSGSLSDWYLFQFSRWVRKCGIDGIYVDNHFAKSIIDPTPGKAPGSSIRAGYQLLAMRHLFKRFYTLLAEQRAPHPYVMVHMTHAMIAPTMSFADIAYEGEDHYIDGRNRKYANLDHIDLWPNDLVRIINLPDSWGCASFWLPAVQGNPDNWELPHSRAKYIRAWYTQLLLHDQRGHVSGDENFMAPVDEFFRQYPDAKFVLYRDNDFITCEKEEKIHISYYDASQEILAVVGNHRHQAANLELRIKENLPGRKIQAVIDAEDNSPLQSPVCRLSVPARDYRLIKIKYR